jgi:hypothetical protein
VSNRTRLACAVLAVSLSIAPEVLSQSQPPSPSTTKRRDQQQNKPAEAQQQPTTDPRGTNESPFVVNVQPTPKTNEETAKEQRKEQADASAKWWTIALGVVTGVVGLLQLVAIGFQVRIAGKQNRIIEKQNEIMTGQRQAADTQSDYMRDGLIETRIAAAAAQSSATTAREALVISQRAYLSVKEIQFGQFGINQSPNVVVQVENTGSLPAILTEWSITVSLDEPFPMLAID